MNYNRSVYIPIKKSDKVIRQLILDYNEEIIWPVDRIKKIKKILEKC